LRAPLRKETPQIFCTGPPKPKATTDDDLLLVRSSFWARILPETFLKEWPNLAQLIMIQTFKTAFLNETYKKLSTITVEKVLFMGKAIISYTTINFLVLSHDGNRIFILVGFKTIFPLKCCINLVRYLLIANYTIIRPI